MKGFASKANPFNLMLYAMNKHRRSAYTHTPSGSQKQGEPCFCAVCPFCTIFLQSQYYLKLKLKQNRFASAFSLSVFFSVICRGFAEFLFEFP